MVRRTRLATRSFRRPVSSTVLGAARAPPAAGCWEAGRELVDTLHIARILLPQAASHSLPLLAAELGLEQPRPHRALDDADATRQLLMRLREEAAGLDEELKEKMLALVAPYGWAIASFFAEALALPAPLGV